MGLSNFFQSDNDEYHEQHNKGSVTHDAIGGLIAYEAAKAYENHLAANGKPDSHAKAKEIIAGLVGVVGTQLAETKGKDLWDEHQKKAAIKRAEERIGERVLEKDYNNDY